MPYLERENGARTYYEVAGNRGAPALLLLNSLGTTLEMWELQMAVLQEVFLVIRLDCRGHGRSGVTPGPYTLEQLGRDALEVLNVLKLDRVHVCGLSLGGLVAQWLGIHAAGRVHRLILCCTAARIGTREGWDERIAAVEANGVRPLIPAILERWYTASFLAGGNEAVSKTRSMLEAADPAGYAGCCAALRDADLRGEIAGISAPTLILYGAHDKVTPAADANFLEASIAGAKTVELDAAHLANAEAAKAFTAAVVSFLRDDESRLAANRERFEHGLNIRRAVLGEDHVARSLAQSTDFAAPFQDLITRYAWGELWDRPGLPRRTRSLLTLAMMVALNREQEFKLHIGAAFRNGVTRDEIQEVLLHTAIYCGLPAANNAFHWAEDAMASMQPPAGS